MSIVTLLSTSLLLTLPTSFNEPASACASVQRHSVRPAMQQIFAPMLEATDDGQDSAYRGSGRRDSTECV
jgi:hypothetical protein